MKDQQTIWKIKAFINQYKWKEINFLPIKKKGKGLNQILNQLLLISYMYVTILKK